MFTNMHKEGTRFTQMVDIEDIGGPDESKKKKGMKKLSKSGKSKKRSHDTAFGDAADLGPMPDESDFRAWLKWNKKNWKLQKEERKKR